CARSGCVTTPTRVPSRPPERVSQYSSSGKANGSEPRKTMRRELVILLFSYWQSLHPGFDARAQALIGDLGMQRRSSLFDHGPVFRVRACLSRFEYGPGSHCFQLNKVGAKIRLETAASVWIMASLDYRGVFD